MKGGEPHLAILDHHVIHEVILGHLGMQGPIPRVLIIVTPLLHGVGITQGPFHLEIGGIGKSHILGLRMVQGTGVEHHGGAGAGAAAGVGVLKVILCSSISISGGMMRFGFQWIGLASMYGV